MDITLKGQLFKVQVNEKPGSACVPREEMSGLSLHSSLRRENKFPIRTWRPTGLMTRRVLRNVELKDHPKKMNTTCLFRTSFSRRVRPHPCIWKILKGRQGGTKGRLQVCPGWRLLVWGSWKSG